MRHILLIILTFGLFACNQHSDKETSESDWIRGTETEKIKFNVSIPTDRQSPIRK